jgi:hypothetical protein
VSDRRPRSTLASVLVWTVWAAAIVLMLACWIRESSPIPMAEDWYTVPLVTGHPVDLGAWLWEQNNEHRMPVARLLLLGVLKAANGDYRAGGLLNLGLLAAGAAGLILFARHLRGGVTDPGDAFFPLTLLNYGHSVDVLFPFQITFVLSLGFIVLAGSVLYLQRSVTTTAASAVAGAALLLLPLSGFIGLLFVPPLGLFIGYMGVRQLRRADPVQRRVGRWLLGATVGALVLGAFYFVGYEHPTWNPPNPGIVPSLKVVLKMFALGFGASAFFWWAPAVIGAVAFLAASAWQGLLRVAHAEDRAAAAGPLVFFAAAILFASGVGWGRAGYVPEFGIPLRYVSISLPAFIGAYLMWTGSRSPWRAWVQRGLALVLLVLLPINTIAGQRFFGDWYDEGMTALRADLARGVPFDELAVRYNRFLVHWWKPAEIERHMRMLQGAGIGPFADAPASGLDTQ